MARDFLASFIKLHILYHASKKAVYGLWLIEEMAAHGYKISPGTLYPILHKFEQERLVKSYSENHEGKIRKYYKTTEEGNRSLNEAKDKLQILVRELIE